MATRDPTAARGEPMATGEKPMAAGEEPAVSQWIVVLLENLTYPKDTRVRNEAESLVGAGHRVTVLAPRGPGESCAGARAGGGGAPLPHRVGRPLALVLRTGVRGRARAAHRPLARGAPARRRHPAPQRSPRHPRGRGRPRAAGGAQGRLRHARLRAGAVPRQVRRGRGSAPCSPGRCSPHSAPRSAAPTR